MGVLYDLYQQNIDMQYSMGVQQAQMMDMQNQQALVNSQLLEGNRRMIKTKKSDVLNYLQMVSGASRIEQMDEFETESARHICEGTKTIRILPKGSIPVQTTSGVLNVEYFLCENCRLLLINKQTIQLL